MICKVLQTIEQHRLLDGVNSLCVGVSGGADSVCLLYILAALQPQFGYSLQVLHVHHHLRGEEADRDAAFVRSMSESLGVPCKIVDVDVAHLAKKRKISVEECGRQVRYAAFADSGCDAVAVAHTLSDAIETSMYHIVRGTSLKGAAGIPAKRAGVIRPLIDCTRAEVEAYLSAQGLTYMTDSTNADTDYTRNFFRHTIVAPMKERFPAFENTFGRFLSLAAEQNDFIEVVARELLNRAAHDGRFSRNVFLQAHPAVRHCMVRMLLSDAMEKSPEYRHIMLCSDCIMKGGGKIELSKHLFLLVTAQAVCVEQKQPTDDWEVAFDPAAIAIETPVGVYTLERRCAEEATAYPRRDWIDAEKLNGMLKLRNRKAGDRFSSPVRKNTKTLKKLFNELKIPPDDRDRYAVLCAEERVVWVEGVGVDAAFAATPITKTLLLVKRKEPQYDA